MEIEKILKNNFKEYKISEKLRETIKLSLLQFQKKVKEDARQEGYDEGYENGYEKAQEELDL